MGSEHYEPRFSYGFCSAGSAYPKLKWVLQNSRRTARPNTRSFPTSLLAVGEQPDRWRGAGDSDGSGPPSAMFRMVQTAPEALDGRPGQGAGATSTPRPAADSPGPTATRAIPLVSPPTPRGARGLPLGSPCGRRRGGGGGGRLRHAGSTLRSRQRRLKSALPPLRLAGRQPLEDSAGF